MTRFSDNTPLPSDLSDRTMTFNLELNGPSGVSVRSCEVIGRGFRNRVSFNGTRALDDVLVPRLARAIRSCLHYLPDGAHVLALPEFLVEIPGLALAGAHILVTEPRNGVRNAILRFKEFIGAVNRAFISEIGWLDPSPSANEKLAVNILAEVCLPILNLCRSFDDMPFGPRLDALHMADRIREFEFQTELLKRFIFNAGMGHADPSTAYLNDRTPHDLPRIPH